MGGGGGQEKSREGMGGGVGAKMRGKRKFPVLIKFYVKRSRSVPRFASKFLIVGSFKILPTYPKKKKIIRHAFDPLPRVENKSEDFFFILLNFFDDIENPYKIPRNL